MSERNKITKTSALNDRFPDIVICPATDRFGSVADI